MPNEAIDPKPSQKPKPTRAFPVLLHVAEVAKILRCSTSSVHRLCTDAELPSLKIGQKRMIARSDLWAYLRRLRTQSLQPAQVSPRPQDTLPAPDFEADSEEDGNDSSGSNGAEPVHLRPRESDTAALAFFSQTAPPAR